MTVAPQHPPVHAYEGEDPYEIIDSKWGRVERWRALANATGELSALTALTEKVRNDAAGIAARQDAREAELNSRADALSARELRHAVNVTQFVDFVGKASVLFDRLHKMRADAQEEPLGTPPGDPSNPSKEPEPGLELEGDNIAGTSPGEPSEDPDDPATAEDQTEFPSGELPHPPVSQPIAVGLDEDIEEVHRGD
jgi:hypothetical protein